MRRIREAKPRMMLVRRDSRAELYMKRDVNLGANISPSR